MKQVIGLSLLVVFCCNAVLADGEQDGPSQSGRIVNGVPVSIANYKFALSLRIDNGFVCGASIISSTHAVTAGHCTYSVRNSPTRVTLYGGSSSPTSGGVLVQVVGIAVHPSYNPNASPGTSDFDVSVLTANTNAFVGNTNMAPIPLQTSELSVDTLCYVVGWGRTNINTPAPSNGLRFANMNIVSQSTCASSWMSFTAQRITSNMICAKYKNGVDVCKGDSGGAFVCSGRLTGIVSFSNPNCNSAWPAGFAKIVASSIRSFIRDQTGV
uniref:Peptidase S1 domain-containing protein n=1 Tax=Anopheles culicifacies TaxID=139723 RepID=A0A182M960_9DIPT